MTETQAQILDAAVRVFVRYGVQRSSMSDIAREAGVARQTLYNAFSNKDEVLRATIRLFGERSLAQINADLDEGQTLETQLKVIFDHSVIAPFTQLQESPNAADFIEGFNQSAKEEILEQDERIRLQIEKVLKPYRDRLKDQQLTAKQLSDFVQRSSSAAKHSATDRRHLDRLLETLIQMVCCTAAGVQE